MGLVQHRRHSRQVGDDDQGLHAAENSVDLSCASVAQSLQLTTNKLQRVDLEGPAAASAVRT